MHLKDRIGFVEPVPQRPIRDRFVFGLLTDLAGQRPDLGRGHARSLGGQLTVGVRGGEIHGGTELVPGHGSVGVGGPQRWELTQRMGNGDRRPGGVTVHPMRAHQPLDHRGGAISQPQLDSIGFDHIIKKRQMKSTLGDHPALERVERGLDR